MYIGLGIYMLLGFLFGLIIELPSGVPLGILRGGCVLLSMVLAPAIILWALIKTFTKGETCNKN